MTRISSGSTSFVKYGFPVIWLGLLGFIAARAFLAGPAEFEWAPLLVVPFMLLVFGFVYYRYVWDLADKVEDGGGFLLARRRGVEQRLSLSDVLNVSMNSQSRPPRLSLRLARPGAWGDEVVFVPLTSFFSTGFSRNKVAEDLMRRVDAARREAS